MRRALAVCASVMLIAGPAAAEVTLGAVTLATDEPTQYERLELVVELAGDIANPYDPKEVALDAVFQRPRRTPLIVPGFYSQPYRMTDENGTPVAKESGAPVWKVRFAPPAAGTWHYYVQVRTRDGLQTSPKRRFEAAPSSSRGFVRVDRRRRVLRFNRGEPLMPVGENAAWGPGTSPIPAYEEWLKDLSRVRANYVRLWLAPWGFRFETPETGVGRYDQLRAWQLEQVLEMSERMGLYLQLSILEHGSFSRTQDPEWHRNPYNVELGGMCRLPAQFVSDPRAKTMFKRLLRYLVARYGYSPHLASWELFNEANYSEIPIDQLVPWVDEMSAHLRWIDPHDHPITISFHKESPDAVWKMKTIDTIQLHEYDNRNFAELFCGDQTPKLLSTYQKPVMVGEFGWTTEFVRQIDKDGIHLHDGIWASALGGASGGGLNWYWDTYLHPNKLYRHYGPLAAFWKGERVDRPLDRVGLNFSSKQVMGCGVGNGRRAYVWMKNTEHGLDQYLAYRTEWARQRLHAARGERPKPLAYPAARVRGATVTVDNLDWFGRYRVEWWDPYTGHVLSTAVARTDRGKLTAPIPDMTFDLAAKLVKLHWWERG